MKINSSVIVFSGKITKIGEINITKSNRKVVSVIVPSRIGKGDEIHMVPFEVSFWGDDAETVTRLPIGTPVNVTGVPYLKPYINNSGKPDFSVVVSATLWNTPEELPTQKAKKPASPSPTAPIPAILNEVMNAGKYKGKGMTYYQILSSDREYINMLIVNDKTPENWKVRLVEVTKTYDDYQKQNG